MTSFGTNNKPILIIFARAPVLGAVKQRLAVGIGPVAAKTFYLNTVNLLLSQLNTSPKWITKMAITPDIFATTGRFWNQDISKIVQGRGDLGQRMERAMLNFSFRPVVIIGSDIPTMERIHIDNAFSALGQNDLVFGPSNDGGYWLVGVRLGLVARGLFRMVRWSTQYALEDTLRNSRKRRVKFVSTLEDIDDVEDFERWKKAG